ncbi:MAG: GDP-L-fucose synthase [Pseudomonadaceae bacterium]|nr:GDP-L-fucose synthase [Pseudomonadaceae bacterium]
MRDNRQNVLVAGANGMVGSAICRNLRSRGISFTPLTRQDCDLTQQPDVNRYIAKSDATQLVIASAKVGGIHANSTYPANFIYENLMISANLIHAANECEIDRLVFLGSSCIYPKLADQPIRESSLLTGTLEPTNDAYAIAKIAGIKLCEAYNRQYHRDYRSLMPTNLYGPNDNFHPQNSHVIPAMMRRFHEAKRDGLQKVTVWGTGTPMREFLHVDDLADATVHFLELDKRTYWEAVEPHQSHINIGTGKDVTIRELAETMRSVVELPAELDWDTSKPDGTPRKLLQTTLAGSLGWKSSIELHDGLKQTYDWFKDNEAELRG